MEISIIIPCYNHGQFIDDAINSVLECKGVDYEIIIVNDGSTDPFTIQKLNELKIKGFKILSHSNKGLGFTRNEGIRNAKGKYILPLDADNKIKPAYIYKALKILNANNADIVYSEPHFFGETIPSRQFVTKKFEASSLFFENYIDACAIYRKAVWNALNGYDENMPFQGQEDWEFWLHAFSKGFTFNYIPEALYYYRITNNSMITSTLISDIENQNHVFILKKHATAYLEIFRKNHIDSSIYKRDNQNPLRTSVKYFNKFLKSLLFKG